MKKVILKKRLEEGEARLDATTSVDEKGEKEKPTTTMNLKKEKTDFDIKTDKDCDMDTDYQEEGVLVIDETNHETEYDENVKDDEPREKTEVSMDSEVARTKKTMFTGVPKTFLTRVIRQIVHSKHNPGKRCRSKRVGYTRAQLHAKKSGQCKKEFKMFMKALEETDITKGEIEKDYDYITARNEAINAKNASTRGRFMIAHAANMTEIGDSVDTYDDENGGGRVRITMVQRLESKLYVVDQGANRTHGKEVLTVYTRDELEHSDNDDDTPAPGRS